MLHLSTVLLPLLLLLLAALANAEVVNFHPCADTVDMCTIDQVRVEPCVQAERNAACHIRRRHPSKISFEFTPKFDADRLEASLGWVKSETEELPLVTLDREACKATTCPVRAGVQQTYTLTAPVEAKFPLSAYTIRWALTDPVTSKRCCFTHDIKVVR
ncbi:MD-2-related lipid-recognition protein-like [Drosophila novamexicana]|uniref:MD-2-related lipid-recognition protein-like n=1 Tax=Drosophila novamexicana TaxID=47314 RepID=UPI0011E5910B|nr:MD-2-related lipid-recognition protein-like [Drosophila novamexicana]